MPYRIFCDDQLCRKESWATNIVDLIENHTSPSGRIKCVVCGTPNASVYAKSVLQENGEVWERWIKGVVRITTDFETYCPYVFLTAQERDGEVDGIHFNYYKDTRPNGGKLKHGHGPGGAPVFSKSELLQLLSKLIVHGCLSSEDLRSIT